MLNNTAHHKIPDETRQRVLDAAAQLAYAPSAAARALRIGRTDTVLFLLPDWPISPTIGALVEHVAAAVSAEGLMLVVHPHAPTTQSLADVWKAITPAAVVALQDFTRQETAALRAAGIASLVVGRPGRLSRGRDFGFSGERIGALQVEHLAGVGHRRLGYALPQDERVRTIARTRLDGVAQACAERGLAQPVVLTVPMDPAAAAAAVRTWRSTDPPVTAVCCFNDNVALAILAGLREQRLRAPDDLAVIGVDDLAAARLADPPLTTVSMDVQALAAQVADVIVSSLNGGPRSRRPVAETLHLIRRLSA